MADAATKRACAACVIGWPVEHSRSPLIHNHWIKEFGLDAEYRREAVPQDLHGSYRRLDQSLQQIHVDATYDVAVALGAALTTSARLGTVVGACATDTSTSNDSKPKNFLAV